ncbi:hypothetical protein [Armatimonas rosea]|uniref:Uncharacterized protein n=1 Tax=Armatimonas rosea TaxID=685828 RepID=A0A7W9WA13_ARMRO|nr:hypothetical protein [Armatimonas rosea]MBB6053866.1 hypothetical protein [Armatimonas rosea]
MNTQNTDAENPSSQRDNHPIVLCFTTETGHKVGSTTLKEVNMAPTGTDIGVSLASQLPSQMSDLMQSVLTTIHLEGLVPVWSYDRLEIEVSSALLMSGDQPIGTPYELNILVRPSENPAPASQEPLPEEIMGPTLQAPGASNSSLNEVLPPAKADDDSVSFSPPSF